MECIIEVEINSTFANFSMRDKNAQLYYIIIVHLYYFLMSYKVVFKNLWVRKKPPMEIMIDILMYKIKIVVINI